MDSIQLGEAPKWLVARPSACPPCETNADNLARKLDVSLKCLRNREHRCVRLPEAGCAGHLARGVHAAWTRARPRTKEAKEKGGVEVPNRGTPAFSCQAPPGAFQK